MKGDFTRDTFNKEKHYSSVRMQQGRVQLDADWNEELDINSYRIETETIDTIGESGAPINDAGFGITTAGDDLLIGAGRYYVNGILYENENQLPILLQPDIPHNEDNNSIVILSDKSTVSFPPPAGNYLIFLDVWQRHLTALEDPYIRESALGGPDTTTRIKTIWQVKLLQTEEQISDINCLSELESWNELISQSSGKLSARAETDEQSTDPCIIAPGAGYRRLENQLYRVEVHSAGQRGKATFKWSRDNGSIVVNWLAQDGDNLSVSSLGRDKYLGFSSGQWIELFDDSNELCNTPGLLVKIIKAVDNVITIDPMGQVIDFTEFPDNPRIRRWDSDGEMLISAPVNNDGWLKLEDGVEVKFSTGDYKTGDYWLIPARTAKADVEWEMDDSNNPVFELPKGIKHDYCRLAVSKFDGSTWTIISDCRKLFPPLTEMLNLFYVSGDGQEVMPDVSNFNQLLPLPQLLKVGISNGQHPVVNVLVRFKIKIGNGNVQGNNEIIISTGIDGIASCEWNLDSLTQSQQVEANLVDVNENQIHLPVIFTANLSNAANVSYNPGKCDNLKEAKTVQDAIDILCRMTGGRDPGIHVKGLKLISGSELQNDTEILVQDFIKGIEIVCDANIEQDTVKNRPTCYVTIYLPYPINNADRQLWDMTELVAYQPLVLASSANADNNSIIWKPIDNTSIWLMSRLFQSLVRHKFEPKILARLTVEGNFIWNSKDKDLFLDGELFGFRKGDSNSPTRLRFPSGNDVRGGNLEMWFYLVPEKR
jgi:hypothetical protein